MGFVHDLKRVVDELEISGDEAGRCEEVSRTILSHLDFIPLSAL